MISGKWFIIILIAPTTLLVVIVAISALVSHFHRARCPACLQKGLKSVSRVRTTSVVNGEEVPDYRSYLLCEKCGSRFKLHEGVLTGVPEDEMADATRFG